MFRAVSRSLLTAALLLCCTALSGQDRFLLGTFHSPKGVGATAMFASPDARELDILTVRTDFYGFLSGRTRDVGASLSYTHDYRLFAWEESDCRLQVHAGAGGMLGYGHDFESGYFSATDRQLERSAGGIGALAGNIALRADFRRRISIDIGFSVYPGVHLRTDRRTGMLLVSFYRGGVINAYLPQLNLMYRF